MTKPRLSVREALALPFKTDARGYRRVYLGKGHPYASESGQQWLHRLVARIALGRELDASEHVHHLNGRKWDCRPRNLEVLIAEYHGALHCAFTVLATWKRGRLVEQAMPGPSFAGSRRGAVLQVSRRRAA